MPANRPDERLVTAGSGRHRQTATPDRADGTARQHRQTDQTAPSDSNTRQSRQHRQTAPPDRPDSTVRQQRQTDQTATPDRADSTVKRTKNCHTKTDQTSVPKFVDLGGKHLNRINFPLSAPIFKSNFPVPSKKT